MYNLNERIFLFINNIVGQSNFLDGFFIFITKFFVPVIIVTSFFWFVFFIPRENKKTIDKITSYKETLLFLFSIILVTLVVEIIKISIAFPRPQQILKGINVLSSFGSYDSFPSMHSALAFAVATLVYPNSKGVGLTLFLFAILVAISRIFVGVHFPVDVLVGAFIGIIIPILVRRIFKHYSI